MSKTISRERQLISNCSSRRIGLPPQQKKDNEIGIKNLEQTLSENCNLIKGFTKKEIKCISEHLHVQNYCKNELLMQENEPADKLMIILNGSTRIINDELQVASNFIGDVIGENIFFEDGVRNAAVQAIEPTSVAVFTLEDFKELLKQNRLIALELRKRVINIRNERVLYNQGFNFIDKKKYVALIAHNEMKSSLINFCRINSDQIGKYPLIATGTTGSLLYKETGIMLSKKVASGPLGGDQAIGQMISTNNIRAVIFFRDPLSSHPHHSDIEALGRLCDVYQIPFATNPSTAHCVLDYLITNKDTGCDTKNKVIEKYNIDQSKILA